MRTSLTDACTHTSKAEEAYKRPGGLIRYSRETFVATNQDNTPHGERSLGVLSVFAAAMEKLFGRACGLVA